VTSDEFTATRLSQDDELLMQRLRAGDPNAVAAIERRYGEELRLFCRRMLSDAELAADMVQDVLATCCRLQAESFPTHSIRGWLYQVARRRCIDEQRKRRGAAPPEARGPRSPQPSVESAVDPLTTPAGRALKQDRAGRILTALQDLDDDLRSVVVMRYFQNLSREEIAEAVGLTVAGTKARLGKALEVLRTRLRQLGESSASL